MPLYEYTCRTCDHAFETLVFNGDKVECPSCRGGDLERQWSVPAKPRTSTPAAGCASDLPPCGPGCCRLPRPN
jgi:putative FmdB family regulatory protein